MSININQVAKAPLAGIETGTVSVSGKVNKASFSASQRLNGKDASISVEGSSGPITLSCNSTVKNGPEFQIKAKQDGREISVTCDPTSGAIFAFQVPTSLDLSFARIPHHFSAVTSYDSESHKLSGIVTDKFSLDHVNISYSVAVKEAAKAKLTLECQSKWFDVYVLQKSKKATHAIAFKAGDFTVGLQTLKLPAKLAECKLSAIGSYKALFLGASRDFITKKFAARAGLQGRLRWSDVSLGVEVAGTPKRMTVTGGGLFKWTNSQFQVLVNSNLSFLMKAKGEIAPGITLTATGGVKREKPDFGLELELKD